MQISNTSKSYMSDQLIKLIFPFEERLSKYQKALIECTLTYVQKAIIGYGTQTKILR